MNAKDFVLGDHIYFEDVEEMGEQAFRDLRDEFRELGKDLVLIDGGDYEIVKREEF